MANRRRGNSLAAALLGVPDPAAPKDRNFSASQNLAAGRWRSTRYLPVGVLALEAELVRIGAGDSKNALYSELVRTRARAEGLDVEQIEADALANAKKGLPPVG